jgi:hypothetical protein
MPSIAYSPQLLVVVAGLAWALRNLATRRHTLSDRRFVALSTAAGLLAALAVGAAFRTMVVATLFGLPSGAIDDHRLGWIKAAIALAAAALSVHESTLAAKRVAWRRCWSKGAALALAVMAIAAYFRFGDLGAARFYHGHEFFHYYLGSKYSRELGYERLYECVALAQAESGQKNEVLARKMMDLGVDLIVPATRALDRPEVCRDRFTAERWNSFKTDVVLFRRASSLDYWNHMQTDHGYNPPPVWTLMGHFWSSLHTPTDGYLQFLASFDLILIAGMFTAIRWAFGWRVFAVAAVFWGCQAAADYYWTGGAFLRQDWLFLLVLSASLLRKGYFALAGASFAYSALLRVFPGVLVVGWVVVLGAHLWRHKRIAPSHARVALGAIMAAVLLVSASVALTGASSYADFRKHILVHKHTPLTNNMGLETVLSQSYEGRTEFAYDPKLVDGFERWEALRRDRLAAFRPLHLVLLAALFIAFIAAVRRVRSLWIAQALSLGYVVGLVELTCYYYSLFILAALLSRHRRGIEQWVLAVAGISQLLAVNRYLNQYFDDKYVAQSVLFCIFAASLVLSHRRAQRGQAQRRSTQASPART